MRVPSQACGMASGENSGAWARLAAFCWLLASACQREPAAAAGPEAVTSLSSAAVASAAPLPQPQPPCPEFADHPKWGHGSEDLSIALSPPVESRTVELHGTGVVMTFGFREFSRAAECLNRKHVVDYLRSRPRTEQVVNITGQDDAQFLVPVAALLDAGHVGVVAESGNERAATIVKSFWTWMGCSGACRHMGREYRLSIPGDVFFRITDAMAHGRRSPEGT